MVQHLQRRRRLFSIIQMDILYQDHHTDALPFATQTTPSVLTSYGANRPTVYRSPLNTYQSRPFRSTEPMLRNVPVSQEPIRTTNSIQAASVASNHSILPTYVHTTVNLGKALLINNILFKDRNKERQGAKKDSQDLDKVLKKLGFEVEHKDNLSGKDMLKRVKQFSQSNFNRHSISLVVIMSHGNNLMQSGNEVKAVPGGFTQISGVDNTQVATDTIVNQFTLENCHSSLKGKPKIFIFQCCRGDKSLLVCHDAAPIKAQTKLYADVLIAFSTLPGYTSSRNPETGTWYIQSLCDVIERHQREFHIEEMLKLVDDQLNNKHPLYAQTSTYESRGFKRCFLYKNS
ncbi:putative inactive caspase B isoform X2 [Dendroctonus ponderosae]|uniref:Caspase family p20 domain-containing protein n=1 Tax=Dendroctonus ponderosae TaxID=77166 RepID=A0AAR5PHP9_DENPD|nr:putative inactive caspase B isoform X2 [Dendroctonus ponderosae]XP_019760577.1 putative inactive caspase B isoform X2 [Dendroctonus ponderosae]